MKKYGISLSSFLITLVPSFVAGVAVMYIASPHEGFVPYWAQPIFLALGWAIILVVPTVVARKSYVKRHRPK